MFGWSLDPDAVASILDDVDVVGVVDELRRADGRFQGLVAESSSLIVDGRRGLARGFDGFSGDLLEVPDTLRSAVEWSCSAVIDATVAIVMGDEDIAGQMFSDGRSLGVL